MNITKSDAWHNLTSLAEEIRPQHLRDLFAADSDRFQKFSQQQNDLLVDFSKQRINQTVLNELHALAQTADIDHWKKRMLNGEKINHTENRAVRHIELRAGDAAPPEVKSVLDRMKNFCEKIHSGLWRGFNGERITDIVNIGIGGSDLGPRMVVRALASHHQADINTHFISNIDGGDIAPVLARLNPRTTLFIIASKTFTTLETLTNAHTARNWILAAAGNDRELAKHFVAISTDLPRTLEFGIPAQNVFEFWDWVGGRFSLWSAIGLSIALAVGWRHFEQLLAGAKTMDQHFIDAPIENNLPLTFALLTIWNTNFLGANTAATLPYAQSLALLPAYLQQLEMESNGKQTDREGHMIGSATSPILWGEAGTNGQHSFFQLFHQGGRIIPCEFIILRKADFPLQGHHPALLANCLAQSSALAFGRTREEVYQSGVAEQLVPYKIFPGNQPSTTIILSELTPYTLGQLISLYEHKVFCLGVLWNINSFDQWGVELGKQLASQLTPIISGRSNSTTDFDSSTLGLLTALQSE